MSEIKYEPDNAEILERCCKIISAQTIAKKLKSRSVNTSRHIEDIKAQRELEQSYSY